MITTKLALTSTPQLIVVPETGARIQSQGGLEFKWQAVTAIPTDLTFWVKDTDVWIGNAGNIYVWGFAGQSVTVTK